MLLKRETSERSENNPISPYLTKYSFYFISFEGFTIKQGKVTSVLDKYSIDDCDLDKCNEDELLKEILKQEDNKWWKEKLEISSILNVPYFIVLYSYSIKKILVCQIKSHVCLEKLIIFNSLMDFAHWLYKFRDLTMLSPYEETGLPEFDKELRKIGKPWPGNLDSVLGKEKKGILALIEFQTTIRTTVRNHCNNTYFLPSFGRKGDEQRWFVMDILRKQLKKPLIILVWSPNKSDNDIKVTPHNPLFHTDEYPSKYIIYSIYYPLFSPLFYDFTLNKFLMTLVLNPLIFFWRYLKKIQH